MNLHYLFFLEFIKKIKKIIVSYYLFRNFADAIATSGVDMDLTAR